MLEKSKRWHNRMLIFHKVSGFIWPRISWLILLAKYKILKMFGRRPIFLDQAEEWDEVVPGMGVYVSDGIYISARAYVIQEGYTPMWKENVRKK